MEKHKIDTLCIDNFYVNGNVFFHSITRNMKFRTVVSVNSRKKKVLLRETKAVLNMYEVKGFDITSIHADKGFSCLQEELQPKDLNICHTDDHVHKVKQSIRTFKERVCCTMYGIIFKRIPRVMNRAIVEKAVKDLNQFTAKDSISNNMSTLTMMTGKPFPDYNKLTLEFGTYINIFKNNDPTNTTRTRTTPAITLKPTGSGQGGYFFMSLVTGYPVDRQQWTVLPMPNHVIKLVEAWH